MTPLMIQVKAKAHGVVGPPPTIERRAAPTSDAPPPAGIETTHRCRCRMDRDPVWTHPVSADTTRLHRGRTGRVVLDAGHHRELSQGVGSVPAGPPAVQDRFPVGRSSAHIACVRSHVAEPEPGSPMVPQAVLVVPTRSPSSVAATPAGVKGRSVPRCAPVLPGRAAHP